MANFIKSKVQQSLSFLPILVVAFSAFSGVLFLNPRPSYAFDQATLTRAIQGEKNLINADLSGADLSGADLTGADLRKADLREADLRGADLREADLREANLSGANLFEANLRGADLIGANLFEANLRGADLIGADLRGAIANSSTKFPDGFNALRKHVIFDY